MATTDYTPLFNSIRQSVGNLANMALKMPAEQAKAELAAKQAQTAMQYQNSQTALNDQKLGAVASVLKGLQIPEGEAPSLDTQNRIVSAVNGKTYLPYSNIGSTGATYSGADGSVLANVENNPLLQKTLQVLGSQAAENNARAAMALKAAELSGVKAQAGGFAPARTGTAGGAGVRRAGGTNGNTIPQLYKNQEEMDDGMGGKRVVTRVDYDALRQANAAIIAAGLDPNDITNHVAYMNDTLGQRQTAPAAAPQASVPTLDLREDSPTAGQVSRGNPMSDPVIRSQVEQFQALVRAGKMSDEEFLERLAGLGIN